MTNTNFSIFLPRIDTRSLPDMAQYEDQDSYENACIAHIQGVFADQGIGTPTSISLLRKYTTDMYLFFVGFVHFESGLAGTPAAARLRASLAQDQEARVPLPESHYWLVHPFRSQPASRTSTLEHQQRLMNTSTAPLAMPSMQRQNTPCRPPSPPARWWPGGAPLSVHSRHR